MKKWKDWFKQTYPAVIISCICLILVPGIAAADSWISGFMRDSAGNLDVTVKNSSGIAAQLIGNGSDGAGSTTGLSAQSFLWAYNGTTFDRLRSTQAIVGSGVGRLATGICDPTFNNCATVTGASVNVTEGGTVSVKLTATTCTLITNSEVVRRIWAAGTETATLSLYTDSGCTNLFYSKIPPNGTPDVLEVFETAVYYKMSGAPAVNDYLTY